MQRQRHVSAFAARRVRSVWCLAATRCLYLCECVHVIFPAACESCRAHPLWEGRALCADCADSAEDGEAPLPATQLCTAEGKCSLRPLCDGHSTLHARRRGHTLVPSAAGGDPVPTSLLGVLHCAKAGHSGVEGRISHVCTQCRATLCVQCAMDDHVAAGHAVMPLEVAGADAKFLLVTSLDALDAGHAHQSQLASRCRSQLQQLTAARVAAVDAVHSKHDALVVQLASQRDALLASVEAAFASKRAAVASVLTGARSAAGQLATLRAAAQEALTAAAGPTAAYHVHRSVVGCEALAADRDSKYVDVTLEVWAEDSAPVFPLGILATAGVDERQSRVAWEGTLKTIPTAGGTLYAMVTLVRHDGSAVVDPSIIAASVGVVVGVGGACPIVGDGSGSASSVDTAGAVSYAITAVDDQGSFCITVVAPPGQAPAVLSLGVCVQGRHVCGSPLSAVYQHRVPLVFDETAGAIAHRDISDGGQTLTTVGGCARAVAGRTVRLHTGPGVAFQFELEVTLGPSAGSCGADLAIAIGGAATLASPEYDYGSNSRNMSFLYNSYKGGVNVKYTEGNGYPVVCSAGAHHVFRFHVDGNQLTFSAGHTVDTLVLQRGSWTLPNDFYLLLVMYFAGNVVHLRQL